MSGISRFVQALDAEHGAPARRGVVERLETRIGHSLPASVRALYNEVGSAYASDGWGRAELLTPKQAYRAWRDGLFEHHPWQVLPVVDDHESNLTGVCCHELLSGYIIHLPHDGEERLVARSIDDYWGMLASSYRKSGRMYPFRSQFAAPTRTARDAVTGRALIEFALSETRSQAKRLQSFRYGALLLPDSEVATLAELLASSQYSVRVVVLRRLSQSRAPEAKEVLREHQNRVDQFVDDTIAAVRNRRVEARRGRKYNHDTLWIGSTGVYHRVEELFDRRAERVLVDELIG